MCPPNKMHRQAASADLGVGSTGLQGFKGGCNWASDLSGSLLGLTSEASMGKGKRALITQTKHSALTTLCLHGTWHSRLTQLISHQIIEEQGLVFRQQLPHCASSRCLITIIAVENRLGINLNHLDSRLLGYFLFFSFLNQYNVWLGILL